MKTFEIYNLAIKLGMRADPRGSEVVKKLLKKEKEKYQKLPKEQKEEYDKDRLENPYSDSRLLLDNGRKVKKILAGIDMETGEMLLAKNLNVDLVISHHPLGVGLARISEVMQLQADVLAQDGLPINIAESLLEKRIGEVARRFSRYNHYQPVDVAKLLGLSLICTHTAADNLVYSFLKKKIEKEDIETVGELLNFLKSLPEYKIASQRGAGPTIFAGKAERRCGKIILTEMTGGTAGSKDIYEKMSHYGIGTVVGMHMEEEYKEEAEKYHINVVIAGHISSDSLGMNLFLDQLEKKGLEIIPCSGLIRISRIK